MSDWKGWRFYGAGLYMSPLAPLLLGFVSGLLTVLMGVSGGFILVPAMIYVFGVSTRVVVGTSLFQGLFVTVAPHAAVKKSHLFNALVMPYSRMEGRTEQDVIVMSSRQSRNTLLYGGKPFHPWRKKV